MGDFLVKVKKRDVKLEEFVGSKIVAGVKRASVKKEKA